MPRQRVARERALLAKFWGGRRGASARAPNMNESTSASKGGSFAAKLNMVRGTQPKIYSTHGYQRLQRVKLVWPRRLSFVSSLSLPHCHSHGFSRRGAGGGADQNEERKRRQRPAAPQPLTAAAAVERGGQGCAAGVGDLGAAEVELLELRQSSSRRRRRTCRRRRRHEGGEALVAERVASETEVLQRGQPPQGRREGHQPRVADGGVVQIEELKPRQGASAQRGGEHRGACVAHMHRVHK
eukprot:scaffold38934_cov55-Phaeocystis_antarctica.AAC.2